MNKIFLLAAAVLFLGAGCVKLPTQQPSESAEKSAVQPESETKAQTLDWYLQNFSKTPTLDNMYALKKDSPVRAFYVKLSPVKCSPTEVNDEISCCDENQMFQPSVAFYTWKSIDWQKDVDVEFYIDAFGGVCAHGGFDGAVKGPFNDNLFRLYKEAASRE